jgi:Trypsin
VTRAAPMRATWRLAALAAGAAAAAACARDAGEARAAITQGAPDDGDRAVAALLAPDGVAYCTGTLVAPNVVLTAAHCVYVTGPGAVSFDATAAPAGAAVPITWRAHPAFVPATLENDVGVVLLAAPAPVAPALLPAGNLDALDGATVRVVGFGRAAPGDTSPARRQSGTAVVTARAQATFSIAPAPSQPCIGDSGGPAFATVSGREVIAGVDSYGDAACATFAVVARADAYRDDFVQPFIDAHRAGGCALAPGAAPPLGTAAVALLVLSTAWVRARSRSCTPAPASRTAGSSTPSRSSPPRRADRSRRRAPTYLRP